MISENLIKRASEGNMDAMLALDRRGLMPAPDEDAIAFAQRLTLLNENIRRMEAELNAKGTWTIEDITLSKDARIPVAIFEEASKKTEKLYGFKCDWVPGFFLNPNFSGLFGGCAYYFYPDFFALFIIRHSFRKQQRWLWYRRDELLAHELCHVARSPLQANAFEELFAYQTATTAFRRITGGIFRSQLDVFLFLGATLLMLILQILRTFWLPQIPGFIGWTSLAAVFAFLVLRLTRDTAHHRNALHKLTTLTSSPEDARCILFHCTDDEIRQIANTPDVTTLIRTYTAQSLRWQILTARFSLNHNQQPAHSKHTKPQEE